MDKKMICESCNKQGAYVQAAFNMWAATMCSNCRRELQLYMMKTPEWKALDSAILTMELSKINSDPNKGLETRNLYLDIQKDIGKMVSNWILAKKKSILCIS